MVCLHLTASIHAFHLFGRKPNFVLSLYILIVRYSINGTAVVCICTCSKRQFAHTLVLPYYIDTRNQYASLIISIFLQDVKIRLCTVKPLVASYSNCTWVHAALDVYLACYARSLYRDVTMLLYCFLPELNLISYVLALIDCILCLTSEWKIGRVISVWDGSGAFGPAVTRACL